MENGLKRKSKKACSWLAVMVFTALAVVGLRGVAAAQDQDDPPSRVARLAEMEGSVSMQPAGENDWVQAVPNRPMTTGDKLWADRDSRAELQLGGATVRLAANTGFSFLNLDDRTVQIQLTAGSLNLRVRDLGRDDVFEVDTPNQAFSILAPGSYRVEASEDGSYSVVTVREGRGECTGNGQTYTVHPGQRVTLSGTDSLNADVEQIGNPDDFDSWAYNRDRRYDDSRSSRYVSHDLVGYEDLDDNGDWRPSSEYGNVWFPRVGPDWAPYHEGHWAWVDPWGWTWVDDAPWGYAPFHYGRWVSYEGRWGWVPGPVDVRPVYAPALVVFVGGGGPGFGSNVAWFPLGPREVFVPSYHVSEGYVNRVNVSNTTVTQTTVTNVYNTTIVNNNTTITNVNYANRNVRGAVTAVPQTAFASAQPVQKAAVQVTPQQLASAPISRRAAVAPTPQAVMGAHANTANHVAAPPQAVASRQVIAKAAPPPPPPPFAARQQALAAHPGQPIPRKELAQMRPTGGAAAPAPHPLVRVAPPGKPATATVGKPETQPNRPGGAQPPNQPANRPGNPPAANQRPGMNAPEPNRPGNPPAAANRPEPNRPPQPPANDRPPAAQPNRPGNPPPPANRPEPNRREPNRPEPNRPEPNRPQPNQPEPNRPGNPPPPNRPEANRPAQPPANERPPAAPPNRAEPNRPEPNRPEPNRPGNPPPANTPPANRPEAARPESNQPGPANRPQPNNRPEPTPPPAERRQPPPENRPQPNAPPHQAPPPNDRPQQHNPPPAEARPPQRPADRPPAQQQTPEEKRKEQQKQNEKQPPG